MSSFGWFRNRNGDPRQHRELDGELIELFDARRSALEPTPAQLAHARARIELVLSADAGAPGSIRRRMALGSLGAGGLWAALAGTAAAHKAAAIVVGAALVVGGAVAAETSGASDTVREAIGIQQPADPKPDGLRGTNGDPSQGDESSPAGSGVPTVDETSEAASDNPSEEGTVDAYRVRARLLAYEPDTNSVLLEVADAEDPSLLQLGSDVKITGPGTNPKDATPLVLTSFVGHLVQADGECGGGVSLDGGCAVVTIHVLGNANEAGAPWSDVPVEAEATEDGTESGRADGNGNGNAGRNENGNAGGNGNSNAGGDGNAGGNGNGNGNAA